jgi:hypothetical protein
MPASRWMFSSSLRNGSSKRFGPKFMCCAKTLNIPGDQNVVFTGRICTVIAVPQPSGFGVSIDTAIAAGQRIAQNVSTLISENTSASFTVRPCRKVK